MGDPAGIGPEVLVRAAADRNLRDCCRLVAFGHVGILTREVERLNLDLTISEVASAPGFHATDESDLHCVDVCPSPVDDLEIGHLHAEAGQAAYDCLIAAARAALDGQVDAITTAPLNKEALRLAGLHYPGHTEILGEVCGVEEFGMMLYLRPDDTVRSPHGLSVVHTTLHTSIRSVPDLLTTKKVAEKIGLMHEFLKRLGCDVPRIAVCALNPHAGENGLFGDEESRIIAPAVELSCGAGMNATGPLPADTLLRRAVGGEFDGVVAMYHDQGHIALKLIGFDRAVNITLGLPIIRTSPSHGTAFDIVGKGLASPDGMIAAIRVAARLAAERQTESTDDHVAERNLL